MVGTRAEGKLFPFIWNYRDLTIFRIKHKVFPAAIYLFVGLFMKAWEGRWYVWHVTALQPVAATLSCAGPERERPSLRSDIRQARNCKTLHTWLRRPCKFYDHSLRYVLLLSAGFWISHKWLHICDLYVPILKQLKVAIRFCFLPDF